MGLSFLPPGQELYKMIPLIASIAGLTLTDEEKYWLNKYRPAGILFFARNVQGKSQLQKLVADIKDITGNEDMILGVDQEGGRVQRLREPDFLPYASQYVLGQLDEDVSKLHAGLISADLRSVGLNFDCAPVVDVLHPETSSVIGSRSFGSDEKKVAKLGKAMVDTFRQNAICPCIKHMPGHGRAATDSHLHLPALPQSLAELESDFYPFIYNNDSPAAMTAHIIVNEIDEKNPVTVSKKAINGLIRGHMGFEGLLVSDAIEMKALSGSIAEKGQQVLAAGCDLVCYCQGKIEDLYALAETCQPLSEQTMRRLEKVWQIVNRRPEAESYDRNKYDRLVGEITPYNEIYDMTAVLEKMRKA